MRTVDDEIAVASRSQLLGVLLFENSLTHAEEFTALRI
jgi:hypothetical protein